MKLLHSNNAYQVEQNGIWVATVFANSRTQAYSQWSSLHGISSNDPNYNFRMRRWY